jgi:lipopolysaccharide export system ATP-binding protein
MITLTTLDERAHLGIAYLPQEASVFRELTVEENILCVLEQKSLRSVERQEQMNQILKEFSIEHIRRSKGRELSGGERRRVEIARIMALRPHFMLLDEPFAGVDPIAVLELMEMINSLKKKGIGILITDHNVRETLKIVDKAYIMNKGEILVAGSPAEIVQDETAKKFYLGEEFSI